jgi:hypothetical protein
MAKKPAPRRHLLKNPLLKSLPRQEGGPEKEAVDVKKPTPKKAPPAKKPVVVKSKPRQASSCEPPLPKLRQPAPVAKKPEPAPVMKPVFEAPAPSGTPLPCRFPHAAKLVMKTGAGGATSLTISSQASAGAAANGNTHPANILVLVSSGGWPVTDLTKDTSR